MDRRDPGGLLFEGCRLVEALLDQNTQVVHSRLIERLRPDDPLARAPHPGPLYGLTNPSGIAALNAEATRQAAMVAYIDDFLLMMALIVASLPLILLLRKSRRPSGAPAIAE